MHLYVFNEAGRHLRTLHALTGATLHTFSYDGSGRLASIVDGSGNVMTIARAADGRPQSITSPRGQVTQLQTDANGYLTSIANPAGEAHVFINSAGGLVTSSAEPLGNTSTYTYDGQGRLTLDEDSASGSLTLARTGSDSDYTVATTTELGRTMSSRVVNAPDGTRTKVESQSAGLASTETLHTDGSSDLEYPDGVSVTRAIGADPRFGMRSPFESKSTISTPGGLVSTVQLAQSAILSNPADLMSLVSLTETGSINGRTSTSVYQASTRTSTWTSAGGRVATQTIDPQGLTVASQFGGLASTTMTFDALGRLATMIAGSGAEQRTTTFTYDSSGYLATIVDPLGRTQAFAYDLAGRLTTHTLTDGRILNFGHDANGRVTSVTPPGRAPTVYGYSPVNKVVSINPPDVAGVPNDLTTVAYDLDHQVTSVTRADGKALTYGFDVAGRSNSIGFSRGTVNLAYSPTSGHVDSVTAPGPIVTTFGHDGPLVTSESVAGPYTCHAVMDVRRELSPRDTEDQCGKHRQLYVRLR